MKKLMLLVSLLIGCLSFAGVKVIKKDGVSLGPQSEVKCAYGLDCAVVGGKVVMKPSLGNSSDSSAVFASGDTSPAVDVGGPFFKSYLNNTVTITTFDGSGIYPGQEITVMSQGAVTYDVTSSGIVCGTTDLVTSSGDLTKFMYDGGVWRCESYIDQNDNLN